LGGRKGWLDVKAGQVGSGFWVVQSWIKGFNKFLSSFKKVRIIYLEEESLVPFVATLTSMSSASSAMVLPVEYHSVQAVDEA
jgi:hypothetical protein